jgi:hypothetical protein
VLSGPHCAHPLMVVNIRLPIWGLLCGTCIQLGSLTKLQHYSLSDEVPFAGLVVHGLVFAGACN